MTSNPHRLPRAVDPVRYDLVLEPDLDRASFTGSVDIALVVDEATDELVCNAAELTLTSAVVAADGTETAVPWTIDEEHERVTFALPAALPAGTEARLSLAFTGTLNDKLRGWYRSTYKDDEGNERVIATSQMQATDCRRAFPCWDEPDFKAVFAVTMVVADDLLAISNGPEVVARGPARRAPASSASPTRCPCRPTWWPSSSGRWWPRTRSTSTASRCAWSTCRARSALAGFGLEVGQFALRWFQDYYGIPYPSDKVDLVALPDFAAGAMENLGCITFRESVLLVDPATATQTEEQLVADVVSHELAHMWFGDLVTMRWWNGIWLNEAFATFMEVAACDAFRPAWKRWETFSLERTAAFETDSLTSTRPVEFEVVSPEDADGMFDVLTYEKGGALLRMLEQYLGEERFRDGIRHYLAKHSYGNTETSDLWDALEATSGEPVRRIMDSWIWQEGYPVVTASLDTDGSTLVLRQHRFLFDDEGADAATVGDTRWAIPVGVRQVVPGRTDAGSATVGGAQESKALLDQDELRLPLLSPDAVVVVNSGGHGFFRVAYDDALRTRLAAAAQRELSTVERYALVDDTWAAVVAGSVDATAFCQLADGFAAEPDVAVWRTLVAGLGWCDRLLEDEPRERFRAFVRALVGPRLQALGWKAADGEDDLTGELRGLLIRALAVLGDDAGAQAKASELFEQQLRDPASVDPPVTAAVVSVVAANGAAAEYDHFVERFKEATTPQEQLRYLYALADFPDEELMARTLEFLLGSDVKSQNAPYALARCIMNRERGEQAWRFVREHWDHANAAFPNPSIVRMVDPVKTLTRPEQEADVAGFFAEHDIPQAAKTLQQVLERQRVNVALRSREAPRLAAHFSR